MTRVVELWVHGIGGDAPGTVLGDPSGPRLADDDIEQVAGDERAGCYRARGADGAVVREAYSWGRLNEPRPSRALWLLLLPFAALNIGGWMSRSRTGSRARQLDDGLVRLLGVVLTSWVAIGLVSVVVDLLAWQCGSDAACTLEPVLPGPALARVGVGALVVAVLLVAMVAAPLGPTKRFDAWAPVGRVPGDEADAPHDLADPRFWTAPGLTRRAARLHLAAVLAIVAALVAWGGRAVEGGWLPTLVAALAMAVAGSAAAAGVLVRRIRAPFVSWALLAGASGVLVAAVVSALVAGGPVGVDGRLPGLDAAMLTLAWVTVVAAGGLWGSWLVAVVRAGTRSPSGPLVGVAVAFGALASLVTAVAGRVAAALGLSVVAWAEWLAFGFVLGSLATAVGGGAWLAESWRVERAAIEAEVRDEYAPDGDDQWVAAVSRARYLARLGTRTAWLTQVWALTLMATMAVFAVGGLMGWLGRPTGAWGEVVGVASWIAIAAPVLVVASVARSWEQPGGRQTVGQIWDGLNVWPRRYHPLAPPCYADRAVPELADRIAELHARGDAVLLVAHSQGSVLAFAALLGLRTSGLDPDGRIGLVTSGSPIGRFITPSYSGTVDAADVATVADWIPWVSFWRPTDPIGGPNLIGGDVRLRDPVAAVAVGDADLVRVHGHARYERDPAFRARIDELARTLAGNGPVAGGR